MSELYEGIVFLGSRQAALDVFGSVRSLLHLRLVELGEGSFGVYRVARRDAHMERVQLEDLAGQISTVLAQAVAIAYDNRCGVRVAMLFQDGARSRQFGDGDALWVPLDEQGQALADVPPLTLAALQDGVEYDCVWSAVDCGLDAIGVRSTIDAARLIDAFCYDRCPILADNRAE